MGNKEFRAIQMCSEKGERGWYIVVVVEGGTRNVFIKMPPPSPLLPCSHTHIRHQHLLFLLLLLLSSSKSPDSDVTPCPITHSSPGVLFLTVKIKYKIKEKILFFQVQGM